MPCALGVEEAEVERGVHHDQRGVPGGQFASECVGDLLDDSLGRAAVRSGNLGRDPVDACRRLRHLHAVGVRPPVLHLPVGADQRGRHDAVRADEGAGRLAVV
jgi:hypothetical protein